MVDVNCFFPTEAPELTRNVITQMVSLRIKIAEYYHNLEQEKGHYPKNPDIAMPETQDYARLIAFRVLEELAEAYWAEAKTHVKEELIDALNYLLNLMLLCIPQKNVETIFYDSLTKFSFGGEHAFTSQMLSGSTARLAGEFPDTLRNRSWMNNAQDLIWSGYPELSNTAQIVIGYIMKCFPSWEDFYKFYIAKNKVLEFRIQSNY